MMEEIMKYILKTSMICVVILLLTGCFPSQHLYKLTSCSPCSNDIAIGGELAFIEESTGGNWRLWVKQPSGLFSEMCIGTVENKVFSCDKCGPNTLKAYEISSSDCNFRNCMHIAVAGPGCPAPGTGIGGHD